MTKCILLHMYFLFQITMRQIHTLPSTESECHVRRVCERDMLENLQCVGAADRLIGKPSTV